MYLIIGSEIFKERFCVDTLCRMWEALEYAYDVVRRLAKVCEASIRSSYYILQLGVYQKLGSKQSECLTNAHIR